MTTTATKPTATHPDVSDFEVRHRSTTPVHVLGHARSGTSVFVRLLRKYLHVAFGTESQFIFRFQQRLAEYGDLHQETNRRRLVEDICRERWFERTHRRLGFETTPDAILADVSDFTYAGVLDATFRQLAGYLEMQRWGDKTPEYINHLPDLYALFPDARYIHVARDGRDVALSAFEQPFGMKNIYCAAVDWTDAMQKVQAFRRRCPESQFFEVRYEDFLTDPVPVFEQLIAFLDIDDTDGSLRQFIADNIDGDLKRGNFEKWRTRLSPAEIRRFDRIAHDHLVHFGYESTANASVVPGGLPAVWWNLDNKARKLLRADYWNDNLYKLRLRLTRSSHRK
ncbi:sulfotransferase family protein [Maioricimonas rarisocia]|nr:sulfotransferase [Maioricimonas rarisocia]